MGYKMYQFVLESNAIEGISRKPTGEEIQEYYRFMGLSKVTVTDLKTFVDVYAPGSTLRIDTGNNVRVSNHLPPKGGPQILVRLQDILDSLIPGDSLSAWQTHHLYESLHPFNDGNGRSGRMLWRWQMSEASDLSFLHHFYYQSLAFVRNPID